MRRHLSLVPFAIALAGLSLDPSGALAAYQEVEVAEGGTIRGEVSFKGPLPEHSIEQIPLTDVPEACGESRREVRWVDVEDGALRGAFVFIEGIQEGKSLRDPKAVSRVIEHRGCRFTPWAQVIEFGPVTVKNSDGVPHHVNARELIGLERGRVTKRTSFNHRQPEAGEVQLDIINRRSPAYIFMQCEEHGFEFGYLMAFEHPYAAVVDEKGEFTFEDVPAGTHTVKAWHPRLGFKTVGVTVTGGGSAEAAIEYP